MTTIAWVRKEVSAPPQWAKKHWTVGLACGDDFLLAGSEQSEAPSLGRPWACPEGPQCQALKPSPCGPPRDGKSYPGWGGVGC